MSEEFETRIAEVIDGAYKDKFTFKLTLDVWELFCLHGALRLAMDHPYFKKLRTVTPALRNIRNTLLFGFGDIGLTSDEIAYLEHETFEWKPR